MKLQKSRKIEARLIELDEDERKAIELRKGKATLEQIAHALGKANASAAHKILARARRKYAARNDASMEDLIIEEEMFLDQLQAAIYGKAISGDVKAVLASVKISESRRALRGHDAPKKTEIAAILATASAEPTPAQARKLMEEICGRVTPGITNLELPADSGPDPEPGSDPE